MLCHASIQSKELYCIRNGRFKLRGSLVSTEKGRQSTPFKTIGCLFGIEIMGYSPPSSRIGPQTKCSQEPVRSPIPNSCPLPTCHKQALTCPSHAQSFEAEANRRLFEFAPDFLTGFADGHDGRAPGTRRSRARPDASASAVLLRRPHTLKAQLGCSPWHFRALMRRTCRP